MSTGQKILFAAATLLGVLSAWEVRASVFAVLLLVIGLSALSRVEPALRGRVRLALLCAFVCAGIGMARFIFQEALPGITEARGRASSKKAVSLLREILFAQDAMRRYAEIDPDGDGVGSAGLLAELSGAQPTRLGTQLRHPPLSGRFAPRIATRSGPATEQDGHYLLICLPGKSGGWVTDSSAQSDQVDDERAERRWVAYAWPIRAGLAHSAAFFIDEHERILTSDNLSPHEKDEGGQSELRLVGAARAPACDHALQEETRNHWRAWQGKKPREGLPGEDSYPKAPAN